MKIKKKLGKWVRFLNYPYQNYVIWQFSWKSVEKNFDPNFRTFLTNRDKNKNEDKKIWGNIFDFWILHIKIGICGNFHKNQRKKFFTQFLRHFWLIEAKMKMKMKRIGKTSSIFELPISKLSYMELFIKIWEKRYFQNFYLKRTY